MAGNRERMGVDPGPCPSDSRTRGLSSPVERQLASGAQPFPPGPVSAVRRCNPSTLGLYLDEIPGGLHLSTKRF